MSKRNKSITTRKPGPQDSTYSLLRGSTDGLHPAYDPCRPLREELESVKEEYAKARAMFWLVVKAAGGKVHINGADLIDFDMKSSVLQRNDTNYGIDYIASTVKEEYQCD